jgi:hypothetical protein
MQVRRTPLFKAALAAELGIEGRPSPDQFEESLGEAIELTFGSLWDDERYVQIAIPVRTCA